MSEIKPICAVVKELLKQNKLTDLDIAKELKMSEANIKRIFSTHNFTLERLEAICNIMKMSLTDLFQIIEKQKVLPTKLTEEQEKVLSSDTKLLLVAVCTRDSWSVQDIITHYQISEHECIQLLAKLDQLNIIQLLPENEYKLLIDPDFRWSPDGPIEKFIGTEVIREFMSSRFGGENSFRFYMRGTYSQSSIDIIQHKLNELTKDVAMLNRDDAILPLEHRQHVGLLVAMRPWEVARFARLRHPDTH